MFSKKYKILEKTLYQKTMKIIKTSALIIKKIQINYVCDTFIYLLASQSKMNVRKITTVRGRSLTLPFYWEYKLASFLCRKLSGLMEGGGLQRVTRKVLISWHGFHSDCGNTMQAFLLNFIKICPYI